MPQGRSLTDAELQEFYDSPDFDDTLLNDDEGQRLLKLTEPPPSAQAIDNPQSGPNPAQARKDSPAVQFGQDVVRGAWNQGGDILRGLWDVGTAAVDVGSKLIGGAGGGGLTPADQEMRSSILRGFGQGAKEGAQRFVTHPLESQEAFTGVRLAGDQPIGEKVGATATNVAAMVLPGMAVSKARGALRRPPPPRPVGPAVAPTAKAAWKREMPLSDYDARRRAAGRGEPPPPGGIGGAPRTGGRPFDPRDPRVATPGGGPPTPPPSGTAGPVGTPGAVTPRAAEALRDLRTPTPARKGGTNEAIFEGLDPDQQLAILDQIENNASGESAASLEALRRQASMAGKGQQYVVYDRAGNKRPLLGPDAVDYTPSRGETYGIEGPEGFTVLDDQGGKYRPEGVTNEGNLSGPEDVETYDLGEASTKSLEDQLTDIFTEGRLNALEQGRGKLDLTDIPPAAPTRSLRDRLGSETGALWITRKGKGQGARDVADTPFGPAPKGFRATYSLKNLRDMFGAKEATGDPRVQAAFEEVGIPLTREAVQDITGGPSQKPGVQVSAEMDKDFRRRLLDEKGSMEIEAGPAGQGIMDRLRHLWEDESGILGSRPARGEGDTGRHRKFTDEEVEIIKHRQDIRKSMERMMPGQKESVWEMIRETPEYHTTEHLDRFGAGPEHPPGIIEQLQDMVDEAEAQRPTTGERTNLRDDELSAREQEIIDEMRGPTKQTPLSSFDESGRLTDESLMREASEEAGIPEDLSYTGETGEPYYASQEVPSLREWIEEKFPDQDVDRLMRDSYDEMISQYYDDPRVQLHDPGAVEGLGKELGDVPYNREENLWRRLLDDEKGQMWIGGGGGGGINFGGLGRILSQARIASYLSGLAIPKSILGNIGSFPTAAWEKGSTAPLKEAFRLPTNMRSFVQAWQAGANPSQTRYSSGVNIPGRFMGAMDQASTEAHQRAGLTLQEAQRLLLTEPSPVAGRLGEFLDSPEGRFVWPFNRTPFNSLIEGGHVTKPGGNWLNPQGGLDWRKSALTAGAMGAGGLLGEYTDDPKLLGLAYALAGPRGIPLAIGATGTAGRRALTGVSPMPEWGLPSLDLRSLSRLLGLEPAAISAFGLDTDTRGRQEREDRDPEARRERR